jgi:hypothetical protein
VGISNGVQGTDRYDPTLICLWQGSSPSGRARTKGILGTKRGEPRSRRCRSKMKDPN